MKKLLFITMALMTSCQNSDINLIEKSKFNSDKEKYNGIDHRMENRIE